MGVVLTGLQADAMIGCTERVSVEDNSCRMINRLAEGT